MTQPNPYHQHPPSYQGHPSGPMPYPPHPGYHYPQQPRNGLAIAGFVLALVGLLAGFIPGAASFVAVPLVIAALPMSIVAYGRARREGGMAGLAVAGIVCSSIGLVLVVFLAFALAAGLLKLS